MSSNSSRVRALLKTTRTSSYHAQRTYSRPKLQTRLSCSNKYETSCLVSRLIKIPANAKSTSSYSWYSSFIRHLKTTSSRDAHNTEETEEDNDEDDPLEYERGEIIDEWEEEDEAEPELGDGGDGGGIVLQGVPWGDRALSIAHEVLSQFGDDLKLYAFKTTPRGYIYVRLDKLTKYGCPAIEEIEGFSQEYKKRLDEAGAIGEVPDLALEVSSPGAERLLKIPYDLPRFKDMPMRVCYLEDAQPTCQQKDGIFMLANVEEETETCIWKLADVKENRDPQSKGRPISRKRKDWRLKLAYAMHKKVNLYLGY